MDQKPLFPIQIKKKDKKETITLVLGHEWWEKDEEKWRGG